MRAMDKTFEYRIYPSAEQEALLQKTFGCCRWVYNRVLAMRRDEYARTGKSRHINSYITQIPAWKRADAPWLSEVDSMALQQSLRDLDKAFKNFFRAPGKVGFPKFKSKRAGRKSYRTNGVGIIDARHVRLPKLGTVRARVSRPVEGRVLSATVKQVPSGKYYVAICCADVPATDAPAPTVGFLGVDAGIHDIATCSTGERLPNPKNLQRSERRLAREQRRLSRQAEGLRKSRQAACQGRAGAREGCQPAEGRPAQVHDACGGRKPKHRGRGPERQGHAEEPPPRQGRGRCRHVGAGAPARVQMRMVGARLRKGGQVLSVQQDVFRMRLRLQGTDAGRTGMGLPRVRHASRPRPERRRQHRPRGKENPGRYRRACGNRGRRRKRLWRGRKTYGCMRSLGNSR